MSGKSSNPWMNMMLLAAESQQVIALRLMKLAAGGKAAEDETQLMMSEKMTAAYARGSSADAQ